MNARQILQGMPMETAKLVQDSESQIILLPEAFRFQGDRVYVKKLGDAVVLIPFDNPWQSMIDSLELFSEDCFSDYGHFLEGECAASR